MMCSHPTIASKRATRTMPRAEKSEQTGSALRAGCGQRGSLWRDAGLLDDEFGGNAVGLEKACEFGWRIDNRLECTIDEVSFAKFRLAGDLGDLLAQSLDHGLRHGRWGDETVVDACETVAETEFSPRWNLRHQRRADPAVHEQPVHFSIAQVREKTRESEEGNRGRSGKDSGDRLRAASERHADQIRAMLTVEPFEEQTLRYGWREEGQSLGFCLGRRGQLVERPYIERRIDHERRRREEEVGDRREVLFGVVGKALVEEFVVGERLA